jgi:hypothetical protein
VNTGATIEADVVAESPSDLDELLDEAAVRAERSAPVSTPLRTQLIVGSLAVVAVSAVVVFVVAVFAPSVAVGVGYVVDRVSATFLF